MGRRAVPGLQSTYSSPISDCGRIAQVASAWKGVKRASLIEIVTAALSTVTPSPVMLPTLAPAMRTSSPCAANEASSKIGRTTYVGHPRSPRRP